MQNSKNNGTIIPQGLSIPGTGEAAVGVGLDLSVLDDPNSQLTSQQVRENAWQIIGSAMTAEVVNQLGGLRTDELIYNYPKASRDGRTHWRACDVMPGGVCPMKGRSHIHIVDVGIKGAMAAMAAYGGLDIDMPEPPELITVGSEAMWRVQVIIEDKWRQNRLVHYQYQQAMKHYGDQIIFDEHGAHICQSKARRNMILQVLPGHLRVIWVNDYLNGREPFDPERVLEIGRKPVGELPQKAGAAAKKPKGKPQTGGKKNADKKKEPKKGSATSHEEMAAVIADSLGLETQQVLDYGDTFSTKAQATVLFGQALADSTQEKLEDLNEKISVWLEANQESDEGEDGTQGAEDAEFEEVKEDSESEEEIEMEGPNDMQREEPAQDDLPM